MEFDNQNQRPLRNTYANPDLFGDPSLDQSFIPQQAQITSQSVDQMMVHHRDFLKFLEIFKTMLSDQKSSTNLKYLLCRLDFNEYYHTKAIKQEEEKKREEMRKRGRRNMGGDSMFDEDFNQYGNDGEDEYGDEDDEDDDDGDEDDDDEDDDEGDDSGADNSAHYINNRGI